MTSTPGIAASCPLNGTFYACDFGERYLGCCANGSPTNICTHGCPQENLLPATFEKRYYDYVTRAACTSGDWWSCANISPPFLGCCLTNPCLAGCPPSSLTAAIFSQNQTDNPLYSAIPNAAAAAFLATSSSVTTVASSTPVVTSGATHSATTSPSPIHENSTGKIVGGAVGGVIAVAGILFGLLLLYRHLWSSKDILSDSSGANEKGSIKDAAPQSTTASKTSPQINELSHELSTTVANPHTGSSAPTGSHGSMGNVPYIKGRTQLEISSSPSAALQEDHGEGKKPQELASNQAPLPEIASSDPPLPCHELPSSGSAVQEQVHLTNLQPGGPALRSYSASNLSPAPQPYGLAFKPHSASRLSEVSSLGNSPSLACGQSPVSVSNIDIDAKV